MNIKELNENEIIEALRQQCEESDLPKEDMKAHAVSWLVGESNMGGRTPISREEAVQMYDQLQIQKEKQNEA